MQQLIRLLLSVLVLTGCDSAQRQEHVSIFKEKGQTVRLTLMDASGKPLAGEEVELLGGRCPTPPCSPIVGWAQKAGPDGSLAVPKNVLQASILARTRSHEPRELQAAHWDQDRRSWVLTLMGQAATICSRYDSPFSILVAEDWRSAKVNPSDEFGLMHCEQGKDAFRTCAGPQVPDAGLSATLTRVGDAVSARLDGESIAGPRELARLDCFHLGNGEQIPRSPKAFTLEFGATGGADRVNRQLKLSESGDMEMSANSPDFGSHITSKASADLMARVAEFLKAARESQSLSGHPRDSLHTSLALIAGGTRYDLEVPDGIAQLLSSTIENTMKNAIIGTWWESEWKLCRPSAQLTAEQVDPPIERLVFQGDNKFSVTWRGGGARAYLDASGKIPHTELPDYSGRYQIQPDLGHIRLTFEGGINHPRDFTGDGFFKINGDKLVLRQVWLGTYKASQKPDICELTFTRAAS